MRLGLLAAQTGGTRFSDRRDPVFQLIELPRFFCGVHIGACEDGGARHSLCMLQVKMTIAPLMLEGLHGCPEPVPEAHGQVG